MLPLRIRQKHGVSNPAAGWPSQPHCILPQGAESYPEPVRKLVRDHPVDDGAIVLYVAIVSLYRKYNEPLSTALCMQCARGVRVYLIGSTCGRSAAAAHPRVFGTCQWHKLRRETPCGACAPLPPPATVRAPPTCPHSSFDMYVCMILRYLWAHSVIGSPFSIAPFNLLPLPHGSCSPPTSHNCLSSRNCSFFRHVYTLGAYPALSRAWVLPWLSVPPPWSPFPTAPPSATVSSQMGRQLFVTYRYCNGGYYRGYACARSSTIACSPTLPEQVLVPSPPHRILSPCRHFQSVSRFSSSRLNTQLTSMFAEPAPTVHGHGRRVIRRASSATKVLEERSTPHCYRDLIYHSDSQQRYFRASSSAEAHDRTAPCGARRRDARARACDGRAWQHDE